MKPLLSIVVTTCLVLAVQTESDKQKPAQHPIQGGSDSQARKERCSVCSPNAKLNIKDPKQLLAAIQQLPGEVHTQQSFEGCTSAKGCAGIKVKDGKVVQKFGNLEAFKQAAAQDTANEFNFHAAGSSVFENGGPFWWMNQNSPFKNSGSSYEKFSKSSSSFTSTGGADISGNPFLNGDFSKLSGGFTSGGAGSTGSGFQSSSSSFESSSFGKGELDLSKNPFLAGSKFGSNQFAGQSSSGSQAGFNGFSDGQGYTGSSPSPFSASTAGSNINLIQNSQKGFGYEQNVDEAFQSTGNVLGSDQRDQTQTCAGQGYVCVPRAQCNNGVVNANGANILQANTQKQYCNLRSEICCRIEVSQSGSVGVSGPGLGVDSATFTSSQGSGLFSTNQGNSNFGSTGFGANFGSNAGSSPNIPTFGQTNFLNSDSFSTGTEFRPGAVGLKPGIPYLPPVDPTPSPSNNVPSIILPTVTTSRPTLPPPRPTYLPPKPSTSAPGYLPPIAAEPSDPEIVTAFPPETTGGIVLDNFPTPPSPVQTPRDIPAGCAAALKCTPIEFCTAEGVISQTSVYLTREQESYRVPLTDCKDIESGRVGKCCRDPFYTDPWPSSQLGKWVPGVFGGNDGQYTPNGGGSGSPVRPQGTTRPPTTGSEYLNVYKPETPGFPGTTVSPRPISPGPLTPGAGQFGQGGVGQYEQGGVGQYEQGGRGQYGKFGVGQTEIGGRKQVVIPGSQFGVGVTNNGGQVTQERDFGADQGVSSTYDQGVKTLQTFGLEGGTGTGVTQGGGVLGIQGVGTGVNYGVGQRLVTGVGQAIKTGGGYTVTQNVGYGIENGYTEVIYRVFLQRFSFGGQCGLLNPQKPYGNHNDLEVDFAEIPWQAMVLLQTNRSLLCGGVITRPEVVVTSASCVDGLDAKNVLIKGGEWKLGIDDEPLPFQIVQVKTIIRHPEYKRGSFNNDVAILVLADNLRFAKNIQPICLPNQKDTLDAFYNGAGECIVTGWGKSVLQAHLQGSIMHSVNVSLLNPGECQAKLSSEYPHLLEQYNQDSCVCGQPTNPLNNICKVDIGSALACTTGDSHFVLRGVYSWDSGCQIGNQIAGFYKFDLEWYEWAIGLIESVRFEKYTKITVGKFGQGSTTKTSQLTGVSTSGVKGITGTGSNVGQVSLTTKQVGFGSQGTSQVTGLRQTTSQTGFGTPGQVAGQTKYTTGSFSSDSIIKGPVTKTVTTTYTSNGQVTGGKGPGQGEAITNGFGQLSQIGGSKQTTQFTTGQFSTGGKGAKDSGAEASGGFGKFSQISGGTGQYTQGGSFTTTTTGIKGVGAGGSAQGFGKFSQTSGGTGQYTQGGSGQFTQGGSVTTEIKGVGTAGSAQGFGKFSQISGGTGQYTQGGSGQFTQGGGVTTEIKGVGTGGSAQGFGKFSQISGGTGQYTQGGSGQFTQGGGVTTEIKGVGAGGSAQGFGKFSQISGGSGQFSQVGGFATGTQGAGAETSAQGIGKFSQISGGTGQFSQVGGFTKGVGGEGSAQGFGKFSQITGGTGQYTQGGSITTGIKGIGAGGSAQGFGKFTQVTGGSSQFSQLGGGAKEIGQFSQEFKGIGSKTTGQGLGQFSQFGTGKFTEGGLNFGTEIKPITNTFTATYVEKKVFQSEPKIVTYTTKPEIVTFTTKPEIVTYTTKPEYVTYTTKPEYVTYTTKPEIVTFTTKPQYFTYTTKPKLVSYTTKPQYITYQTSDTISSPQIVAPDSSFNPSFSDLVGKHKHNAQCKCLEGKN